MSSTRTGDVAVTAPGNGTASALSTQPTTSATRWVGVPETRRSTLPSAPTLTSARLLTVRFAAQFSVDAVGSAAPCGNAVRYPLPEVPVATSVSATADTPVEGTPAAPVTVTEVVEPAARTPAVAPVPFLVSSSRVVGTAW